jgi:hypothetical protein
MRIEKHNSCKRYGKEPMATRKNTKGARGAQERTKRLDQNIGTIK